MNNKCCEKAILLLGYKGTCTEDCPFERCYEDNDESSKQSMIKTRNTKIRRLLLSGSKPESLAKRFSISKRTVYRIANEC
jgi:hypothetical protein